MARVTYAAYEARGWGVGEVWLDGDRVVQAEHPRPTTHVAQSHEVHPLAGRMRDWFAGADDDFLDDLPRFSSIRSEARSHRLAT